MKKTFNSQEIREFPIATGVYAIIFKNSKNNKMYIGSASSQKGFYCRWKKHISLLRNNKHHSKALQNAFDKYGESNIEFIILEECNPSECISKEQFYINKHNSFKKGYNGRPIADNNFGYKQTDKQKNTLKSKYKSQRDLITPEVITLYNQNKTTREISNLLSISRGVISKIFKENNIVKKNTASYTKKTLYQYDIDGNFIKEWDNINLCCNNLNIKPNTIRDVINKRSKHAKGFYFSLTLLSKTEILENLNNLIIKSKNRKYFNIKQFDSNNIYIKTWRDVKEIVDHFKLSNTTGIIRAIKGEVKTYKNFIWNL